MGRSGYIVTAIALFAVVALGFAFWYTPRLERGLATKVELALATKKVPYWQVRASGRDIVVLVPPGAPQGTLDQARAVALGVAGVSNLQVRRYGDFREDKRTKTQAAEVADRTSWDLRGNGDAPAVRRPAARDNRRRIQIGEAGTQRPRVMLQLGDQ